MDYIGGLPNKLNEFIGNEFSIVYSVCFGGVTVSSQFSSPFVLVYSCDWPIKLLHLFTVFPVTVELFLNKRSVLWVSGFYS